MEDLMLRIDNVSKQYVLGQIGGTTLRDELQRWSAKMHGREDPTKRIGAKDYNKGETFLALNGISFDVKNGERVGIIGHNGAGKSTLLKLISRVTAPTSGRIGLNGRVASMLEVGTGFHGELTGRENIYMNGAILGMTKKEIDAKMEDIIEFSECRQFIDTPVKRYSSGMYVRLAFSVAAHLDSEIMIMDEVLAVGDTKFQKKCLGKMSEESKQSGKTILYVSHNMATIKQLCDRCIVLDHGKLIFDGDVDEGIKIYSGPAEQRQNEVDMKNIKRRPGIDQRARINNITLLNDDGWSFSSGSHMKIRINWKCFCDCDTLIFRLYILNSESQPVAAAVTSESISALCGETYDHDLEIDLGNLMPDQYWMTILITNTEQSRLCDFDWVERAFAFEIMPFCEKGFIKTWDAREDGNVRLPDVRIRQASV